MDLPTAKINAHLQNGGLLWPLPLPDGAGPGVHAEKEASGFLDDLEDQQGVVVAVAVGGVDDQGVAFLPQDHTVDRGSLAYHTRVPGGGGGATERQRGKVAKTNTQTLTGR